MSAPDRHTCYHCGKPLEMDEHGAFCLLMLADAASQLLTDQNGNPWITAWCIVCGHTIGLKTLRELRTSGQASIEPIV